MGTILKESYEIPQIYVEEFTPNHAIATCNTNVTLNFQCLNGGNTTTDSATIIGYHADLGTSSCNNNASFTTCKIITNSSGSGSSSISNNTTNWSWSNKTATYSGSAEYIVYLCMNQDFSSVLNHSSYWSSSENTLTHNNTGTDTYRETEHVLVSPVTTSVTQSS